MRVNSVQTDMARHIRTVARQEFMQRGVRKTSMRAIASKAGIGLGSIYHYYEGKEDLLCAVLQPLLDFVANSPEFYQEHRLLAADTFVEFKQWQPMALSMFRGLLKHHSQELRLLLTERDNPMLNKVRERLEQVTQEATTRFMKAMERANPGLEINIPPALVRILNSLWLIMMREIVTHEEMTEQEKTLLLNKYFEFSAAGWIRLMDIN